MSAAAGIYYLRSYRLDLSHHLYCQCHARQEQVLQAYCHQSALEHQLVMAVSAWVNRQAVALVTCFSDVNSKLQKLDPDALAVMALVEGCKFMKCPTGSGFFHLGDSVSGDRCEISVIVEVADAFLLRPSRLGC